MQLRVYHKHSQPAQTLVLLLRASACKVALNCMLFMLLSADLCPVFFMSTLMRSPLGYKKKGHSTNNTKKNARLSVTSRSIKMQQDEKCFAQVTTRMEMTGNYFTPAQPLKL
jgi:hypothetical protein